MSSSDRYSSIEDLYIDLNLARLYLRDGLDKLAISQIRSEDYRICLDNFPLTIGLAIEKLTESILENCIKDNRVIGLAHFVVRPMQELCIDNATVNYLENELNINQKKILTESRLMQSIASSKNSEDMRKMLEDEKSRISEKCFSFLSNVVDNYQPDKHYDSRANNGVFSDLNDRSSKKIKGVYSKLEQEFVKNPLIFRNFKKEESWIIFSNLLHGNPEGILLASDDQDNSATVPFFLLRMVLYDAELIARYLNSGEILKKVIELQEKVIQKAYSK